MADLLTALPDEHQLALRLRVVEERSYAEVAAALGVDQQAARARVSRALRGLATDLDLEPAGER